MAVDVTAEYWGTVLGSAKAHGADEDKIKKLRSAQLLRSLAAKTDFTRAAVEVANNILALRQYLKENQRDYAQQGKLRESERDRIEEEVGAYVRSCSANIGKLQHMLAAAEPATPGSPGQPGVASTAAAAAVGANEDVQAHRQGMVLILSERLKALTGAFDRLRSLRYQQLQQQEAARLRRQPQRLPSSLTAIQRQQQEQQKQQPASQQHPGGDVGHQGRNGRAQGPPAGQKAQTMGDFHKLLASPQQQQQQQQQKQPSAMGKGIPGQLHLPQGAAALSDALPPPPQQHRQRQQQVQLDPENKALELELISMSEQVTHAERTVREIATLNQMFSTAIMHQSEQIEKLYSQAVDASHNIGSGNVQLRKAIKVNSGTKKYLLVFLLVASLALLLFDWWSS